MKIQLTIDITINPNFLITEKEIMEEILLAETRMNERSLIRFHIKEVKNVIEDHKDIFSQSILYKEPVEGC